MSTTALSSEPTLSIYSPAAFVHAELIRLGQMSPWDYVKDRHYRQYVIPLSLTSMEDVQAFVQKLEQDGNATESLHKFGCAKALVLSSWLKYKHSTVISPLDWAITSVAHARRTCCSCHHPGCFAPRTANPRNYS